MTSPPLRRDLARRAPGGPEERDHPPGGDDGTPADFAGSLELGLAEQNRALCGGSVGSPSLFTLKPADLVPGGEVTPIHPGAAGYYREAGLGR